MKKVLFTATVDSHIKCFHIPFLKWFHENGYEVHVATNGDEEIPYCDKKIRISFARNPFKLANLKAIKDLKKVIMEEKYDIIHTHTPMGAVVTRLAAKKARKKIGTRVIYTAHGFHFFKGASKLSWLMFYPVEKYLSKFTDTLITINQEDYNLAKSKFKKCKNVEYVPGVGIDALKFNLSLSESDKLNFRAKLGIKESDFVLIYVARMDKNKNQGFLIECMKDLSSRHNNIHLLLVGPDENNGIYQEQAKDVLNVHFLGFRRDIPELMSISDIAVSSSLREGLPVNIMEAMISSLPVVATDTRGVRDLVSNGKNGFVVEKNNVDQFVESVLKLYNDKDLRESFRRVSKEISKDYELSKILEMYIKIYLNK